MSVKQTIFKMKKPFYYSLFIFLFLISFSKSSLCQTVSVEGKGTKTSSETAKKTQSNSPVAVKVCELMELEPGYPPPIISGNKEHDDKKNSEVRNEWINKHPERYKQLCQDAIRIVNESTK